jgi:nicotinate phosphoribosyltransferase
VSGPDRTPALFTDLYELAMGSVYLAEELDDPATFELWIRDLPPDRNFLVVAGIDAAIEYLERLHFDAQDIAYLSLLGLFEQPFLDRLAGLSFTGDAWAMPEGTVTFAGEPLLRVTAPRIEAQVVETALLAAVTFQTMIATKAARIALAAGGRPFVDFSGRRDHGWQAALLVARSAYIGGAAGTSNVHAAREFGIPPSGTMAHSFVLSFPTELAAFRAYVRGFPDSATLLIDTYDTLQGARHAVVVAAELEAEGHHLGAVRLDSGDLAAESLAVRAILDAAGLESVRIFASGDLDEFVIESLLVQGAAIDAFGVGTRLGSSYDAPALGSVYKLVEDRRGGRAKFSTGKETMAFAKQVYREYREGIAAGDTLALASEQDLPGTPLLQPAMQSGRRLHPASSLESIRRRREQEVATLPAPLQSIRSAATPYAVRVSPALRAAQSPSASRPSATEEPLRPERPRDEFGRPLPWGSQSHITLLDYERFSIERNHELAIDYFNDRQFFPAHEAWEGAWRKAIGSRDEEFFNGLAKLGAGLTHVQRGNSRGARTLIEKAIDRIGPHGPAHRGILVARLCDELRAALDRLPRSGPAPRFAFPEIHRSP